MGHQKRTASALVEAREPSPKPDLERQDGTVEGVISKIRAMLVERGWQSKLAPPSDPLPTTTSRVVEIVQTLLRRSTSNRFGAVFPSSSRSNERVHEVDAPVDIEIDVSQGIPPFLHPSTVYVHVEP